MKVDEGTFTLSANDEQKAFQVRVFKFFSPRSAKSKVSLVAHRREVTDNALQAYVPEFAEEFYEPGPDQDLAKGRNFVIKAYVFGDYLNDNVSLERGESRFQTDADLLNGISQTDIEQRAAEIAQTSVGAEIAARKQRKQARIVEYVETQAPWHRSLSRSEEHTSELQSLMRHSYAVFCLTKQKQRRKNTSIQP